MKCPICDRDIDALGAIAEIEAEGCPLCRALIVDGTEVICATDLATLDVSGVAVGASLTPGARRSIEDAFNWY